MDWTAPIDLYCERLGPEFWAEPVNALSNFAFFIAALYALIAQRRSGRRDAPVVALAIVVAFIGLGSLLFHLFGNTWSVVADVVPIMLFIYGYLALALTRFLGLSGWATALVLIAFFALNWPISALLTPLIAGSAGYAPALLAMLIVGALLHRRGHPAGPYLLAAAAVFLVSLTLRTIDLPLCADIPLGTHWLWHILNAVTLAVLLRAAIVAPPGRASAH